MKKTDISTVTYEHGDFLVDIVTTDTVFGAWVYHKDFGAKSLMFEVDKNTNSPEEFLQIVEANLDEHEELYAEEYSVEDYHKGLFFSPAE